MKELNKDILKLAIPNIIGNITVPLLSLADLAFMGHLGSEIYIAAIAVGGLMFNFLYWNFAFLRMSTSGLTAQDYGRNNKKGMILNLYRPLVIAIVGSLLIVALQIPIAYISLQIISGTEEVKELAKNYFYIRIWAAPATICSYVISGWFVGMQNTKLPMIISIASNIFNIAFSSFFIFVVNIKIEGAAWGTLIAQYLALLLSVFFVFKYFKKSLGQIILKEIFDIDALKPFFMLNSNIFIRTLCIIIVFSFFTLNSANRGEMVLAFNTILLEYLLVFAFFLDGFANAAEAIIGKYVGMRNNIKLKKAIPLLFKWGGSLGILFAILYYFFGKDFMYLLTDNKEITTEATPYIIWVALIPLCSFASFIWDGIFIGATASKYMRNTMLLATFGIFFPSYYLFEKTLGNHSLWFAMCMFMISRGIFQTIINQKAIFKKLEK